MGTPGHMAHPFDSARVQTGQDLIKYFGDIKEFLELNPGSLKIDGINVSFKLITTEDGKKEFRMDRGTTHTESVIGMNAEDAYKKWPEGHGMPPAIKTLLEIFNEALPSIQYELKDLGMWDNPSKFFNTEYVAGKTNVQKYDRNFLAIHGVNQFYEKKGPKSWVASGKSADRKGLKKPADPKTGKPVKAASTEIPYNRGALESLIKKVKPFASQHGFEIYGDVPTELITEIDFSETLASPFTIQMTKEDQEIHSIEEWLADTQNPRKEKVTKSDGTLVDAISKEIYMAVLNEIPLTEYLKSPEDVKKAISGALFNHTTRMLGNDVKSALDSSMGSVADHEGVVLRGMEEFPVKVTGEFIIGGMQTAFREGVIKEVEELKGIKDVEEEYNIETVNLDEPEGKRKIALIPGGFKPPHRGHVALVTHYLDEVAPDGKVILYMGSGGDTPRTIHGKAITYEDALQIWKIYLNNENIAFPNEILEIKEVEGGPIGSVVDYVKEADPDEEIIYLGAGKKDGKRWEFMLDNPQYNPNKVKVFIEPIANYNDSEGKPMSATNFRQAIETGEEDLIKSYLPESSHDSYREIMDVFEGRLKESQQPLGIFLRLIEETINEQDERERTMSPTQFGQEIIQRKYFNSFEKLKKEFINITILTKKNLEAAIKKEVLFLGKKKGVGPKALDKIIKAFFIEEFDGSTMVSDIRTFVADFVSSTKLEFFPEKMTGPSGSTHAGAFYRPSGNFVGWTFWNWALFDDAVKAHASRWGRYDLPNLSDPPYGSASGGWKITVYHELGHAKDRAIRSFIDRLIGSASASHLGLKPSKKWRYSGLMYQRGKRFFARCFPEVKDEGKRGHAERVHEWYASVQTVLAHFKRNELIPEDIQLICLMQASGEWILQRLEKSDTYYKDRDNVYRSKKSFQKHLRWWKKQLHRWPKERQEAQIRKKELPLYRFYTQRPKWLKIWQTWRQQTPAAGKSHEEAVAFLSDFKSHVFVKTLSEPWEHLNCACDPKEVVDSINIEIAKLNLDRRPSPRSDPRLAAPAEAPLAENFLNIIEETIDETIPGSDMTNMFGFAAGNLSNITRPDTPDWAAESEEEEEVEEKPTAKDALEAFIAAIEKVAEESGVKNGDDEELEEISAMGAGDVEGPGHRNTKKKKQTSLIREVEDYLFKMLGVNL